MIHLQLTWNSLCTGRMSKHHFTISITNAIQVRNLIIDIIKSDINNYLQQPYINMCLWTNNWTNRIPFKIKDTHPLINRNKTTFPFYMDLWERESERQSKPIPSSWRRIYLIKAALSSKDAYTVQAKTICERSPSSCN